MFQCCAITLTVLLYRTSKKWNKKEKVSYSLHRKTTAKKPVYPQPVVCSALSQSSWLHCRQQWWWCYLLLAMRYKLTDWQNCSHLDLKTFFWSSFHYHPHSLKLSHFIASIKELRLKFEILKIFFWNFCCEDCCHASKKRKSSDVEMFLSPLLLLSKFVNAVTFYGLCQTLNFYPFCLSS